MKSKLFRKPIAILLALTLLTGWGTNVFASQEDDTKSIIQINGVELVEDIHIVSVEDMLHCLGENTLVEYEKEIELVNGYYTLTSSMLIEMFSFAVNGDKLSEWNELSGSRVDVSIRNGVISVHSSKREEPVLRDRTFTVTDQQKAGYVGYYGLFKLTTRFSFTDSPVMFSIVSADKSAERFNNWLMPDYTTDSFEVDAPSSATTGARWSFTVNGSANTQYNLATYSHQG